MEFWLLGTACYPPGLRYNRIIIRINL